MARIYDTGLGGKDNFAADRELAGKFLASYPYLPDMARDNKQFLARAVTWAAGQGAGQFIDLGCGMPSTPSTLDSARAANPDARAVYLDNDPVVISHMRAICKSVTGAIVVDGDVRDPGVTLRWVAAQAGADLASPVCVVMGALLHFLDGPAVRDLIARFTSGLAPGSILVASIATGPGEVARQFSREYSAAIAPYYLHSLADFAGFFDGLELVPPGVTEMQAWRPGWTSQPAPAPRDLWGYVAVARLA